jgi:hypothetical protein
MLVSGIRHCLFGGLEGFSFETDTSYIISKLTPLPSAMK